MLIAIRQNVLCDGLHGTVHLMIWFQVGSRLNKSIKHRSKFPPKMYKLLEMLIDTRRELIDNLLMIWTLIDKEMMIKSLAILSIIVISIISLIFLIDKHLYRIGAITP